MLSVTSIKKGIVIDHISPGRGYELFNLLNLDKADYTVALIMNAKSQQLGKKDLIKIENEIDLDFSFLGMLDDSITVNIIENERVTDKIQVKMPEYFEGIYKCKNPRCIVNAEREVIGKFELIDKESKTYKCVYCDHILERKR